MPKVSVIIPVYNMEQYIRECLDSVINQTLKDIEIICVNDGSTDRSLKILEEYAQKDERIIIISQQNSGVASARNVGIEKAQGEYLSILDSDDYFSAAMLEKLYEKAINENLDIAICHCNVLDCKHNKKKPAQWTIVEKFLPEKAVFSPSDISEKIFNFCIGWAWDKLYRTDFIRKHGLSFPNLSHSEDVPFVFASLVLAERIAVIKDCLIIHKLKLKNQRSQLVPKDCNAALAAIENIKLFLEKEKVYSCYEKSFLNWVVVFLYWIVKSADISIARSLLTQIRKELFVDLNLYSKSQKYFYDEKAYCAFMKKRLNKSFLYDLNFLIKHWMFYCCEGVVNA